MSIQPSKRPRIIRKPDPEKEPWTVELPPLKPWTVKFAIECFHDGRKRPTFRAKPEAVYQAKNVCPELMNLVVAIRAHKIREESGYYTRNNAVDEEDGITYRECLEDERECAENVVKLGKITAVAVATDDEAFPEHLRCAISFAKSANNRRRVVVAAAVSNSILFYGKPTLKSIAKEVERLYKKPVASRTIKDDLDAMKVRYEKRPRGAPGGGEK